MKKYFYLIGIPVAILFLIFAVRQFSQTTIYIGYDINENGEIDEKEDLENKLKIYIPARVRNDICIDPFYEGNEDHVNGSEEIEPDFDCRKLKDRKIDDQTLYEYLLDYSKENYEVQELNLMFIIENDGYNFKVFEHEGYIYILII